MIYGFVVLTVGTMMALIAPVQRVIEQQRWQRTAQVGALLRDVIPVAPADEDLTALTRRADAALARDRLLVGVAGVAEIYDRA